MYNFKFITALFVLAMIAGCAQTEFYVECDPTQVVVVNECEKERDNDGISNRGGNDSRISADGNDSNNRSNTKSGISSSVGAVANGHSDNPSDTGGNNGTPSDTGNDNSDDVVDESPSSPDDISKKPKSNASGHNGKGGNDGKGGKSRDTTKNSQHGKPENKR